MMIIMVKNDRITIMVDGRVVRHAVDDLCDDDGAAAQSTDPFVIYCLPCPI